MQAFFVALLPPVAVALLLWAWTVWLSFRAADRKVRRSTAAVSALLTICGSITFFLLTSIDDFNDYPGFTCYERDGRVPPGFPLDRLPAPNPDLVSTFNPSLDWSHQFELLPAGVRCTYWTKDDPRITVITHSHWSYSAWSYGFLIVALAQAARVANPDLLYRGARLRDNAS